jgi:hypothetical protein
VGEGRTGECSEPSMMPRYMRPRKMEAEPGCRDCAVGKRRVAAGDEWIAHWCAASSASCVPVARPSSRSGHGAPIFVSDLLVPLCCCEHTGPFAM